MNAHANKSQENNNKVAVPVVDQKQGGGEGVFQFIDDRSETASLHKLQDLADNAPKAMQFKFLQNMANQRSDTSMLAQLQAKADKKSLPYQVTQLGGDDGLLTDKLDDANEAVQFVADKNIATDKLNLSLQKSGETNTAQLAKGAGGASGGGSAQGNSTGMPDNLKSGIESLSGMSMDHVKVHRNSDAPAQLNAHAYAQGSDIHVGPGQEKHLPHEAWHVVQQAQGRVQPTRQMKGKVNINDDAGLEKEADVMGAKALKEGSTIQGKFNELTFSTIEQRKSNNSGGVVQGLFGLSNPFSGLFGGKKKTNEQDGAAPNNAEVVDVDKLETDELNEKKENETASEEVATTKVDESDSDYNYNTQYWVTESDTLRDTDKIREQAKTNSEADVEAMLKSGKTKSAGKLDSFLGMVGLGKQQSLLGPKLDPKKNKFYYPAMVDESSPISKMWKPIKIGVPANPNEHFKSKYEELDEVDGFYPVTKMVAMPHDYNAFLDLKTKKAKAKAEENKETVAPPSNEMAKAKTSENKAEGSSASTENTMEQNIVEEAGEISGVTAAPAKASVEEAPTKEKELQKDVEKAEEGKLDLFKKYGKRIFTFATKFSFVRSWVNSHLQEGTNTLNELALKAKESAKSVPLLSSLTLVSKPEGNRVTPAGVTFNFGVKFPFGDNEVELSTQLFTDTQSDYSTSYIGSSATGVKFSLGGDGDGPELNLDLGTLTHHFNLKDQSRINSTGGSADLSWGSAVGSIQWNLLSFSASETPKLESDLSGMDLSFDIYGANVKFGISDPKLTDNKLEFTEATASLSEIEFFENFKVGPTDVTITSTDDAYDITGSTEFKFSNELITNASGNIILSRIGEEINFMMTDGNVNVQFNEENKLSIKKLNYNYLEEPLALSAESITSDFNLSNPISSDKIIGNLAIDSPKINEDGFTFFSGTLKSPTGLGLFDQFQIKNIEANTNHRKFEGSANFKEYPNATSVKEAGGNLSVEGGYKKTSKTHFILNEGSFRVDFLGQSIAIAGIKYDNIKDKTKVSADSANLNIDFENPIGEGGVKASGEIIKPSVSSRGFDFTSASVKSEAPINLFNALTFNEINAAVKPDESYSGEGDFSVIPGDVIKTASGKVSVTRAKGDKKTKYSLTNGALTVDFGLGVASLSGVNYSSDKPGVVEMNRGQLTTEILGKTITLFVEGATVSQEDGFDYVKVGGTLSDLSFGEAAKFTDISVEYDKTTKTLTGTTDFNLTAPQFDGFAATTAGNVTVSKDDKGSSLTLAGASLNLRLGGQTLDLEEMNYAESMLTVGKGTLGFDVFENKITATVKDGTISKDGFNYSSASLDLNSEINFGIGKATIGTVTATKTDEGTKISGNGSLSVGGGTILGISLPELTGKGEISHTFVKGDGKGKTEKDLKEVGGKLPDIRLPDAFLPSGFWPFSMNLPIPVAPALSVSIFAGVKGGFSLKNTSISISKESGEGKYKFNAKLEKTPFNLAVAIGVGAMVGNPLVASLMVGLEASGGVEAIVDASFSKEFDTSGGKFELGKSESNYGIKGDINLAANLVLEAQALYFLKKRKEILLGKKILGSFEGSKDEKFKFIKAEAPLMKDKDHEAGVKEMLPGDYAKMSLAELNAIPQSKRFSGEEAEAAVEGLATAAGGDSNKQMKILGDFLYDRVDFVKLKSALIGFIKLENKTVEPEPAPEAAPKDDDPEGVDNEKTKSFFTKVRESEIVKEVQVQLQKTDFRRKIGHSIHLKEDMVRKYKVAINSASQDNPELIQNHSDLRFIYKNLNNFKQKYHSGLIGDDRQSMLTGITSWGKKKIGLQTEEGIFEALLEEIPKVIKKRNRIESIQASIAASLPSDEG